MRPGLSVAASPASKDPREAAIRKMLAKRLRQEAVAEYDYAAKRMDRGFACAEQLDGLEPRDPSADHLLAERFWHSCALNVFAHSCLFAAKLSRTPVTKQILAALVGQLDAGATEFEAVIRRRAALRDTTKMSGEARVIAEYQRGLDELARRHEASGQPYLAVDPDFLASCD